MFSAKQGQRPGDRAAGPLQRRMTACVLQWSREGWGLMTRSLSVMRPTGNAEWRAAACQHHKNLQPALLFANTQPNALFVRKERPADSFGTGHYDDTSLQSLHLELLFSPNNVPQD